MDDRKKRIALELASVYGGEIGERIVEYLIENGEAADEKIAEDLQLQVGSTRKVLYVLQDKGVVSSRIERSPETGWITYFWYVPLDQMEGLTINIKRRIIGRLEKRLEYESNNVFYWCATPGDPKLTFSEAVDNLFRCPKCGKHLKPYDNSKLIAALKWVASKLKKEVETTFEKS